MSATSAVSLLLIEDNPGDARLLREMLNEQGMNKTTLVVVASLGEAEEHLAEHQVDIILLDLGLPDAQGLDAVRRARTAAAGVPLVVLTGRDDEALALHSLQEGAQDYLVKGQIETRALWRAVRYAIERNLMEVQLGSAFTRLGLQSRALETAAENMQEAHDQLNELLAHSPSVLYSMNAGPETVSPRAVSANVIRLLGFSPAETLNAGWWSGLIHPDDRTKAEAGVSETLARGTSRTEYRMRHKNGTYVWIDDNQRLVQDATGTRSSLAGAWTDVTERRDAQNVSLEGERRFSEMLNNLQVVSVMLDCDGRLTYCNDYFLRLTGWSRNEVIGSPWESFFPMDHHPALRQCFSMLREDSPEAWHNTNELLTKPGERRLVQWSNAVLRSSSGEVIGTASIGEDITDRKGAEERIREQAALIDQAHDAMVVRDLDDKITFWSKGAERIYGWSAGEVLGSRFGELLHVDPVQYNKAVRVTSADGAGSAEINKTTAAGTSVIVDSRWTLLRDDKGQPKAIFSIDTDITERRQYEQQFLRNQRLDSLGTLAGGIAHDLNNLLLPIRLGVSLLRRSDAKEFSEQAIDNIDLCAKRGADLVNRVLLFASGTNESRKAVDLGTIVDEVRAIAESTFPKNISISTSVSDGLSSVLGDQTQLLQVLLNLALNARDALRDGGHIRISATNSEIDENYAVMRGGSRTPNYVVLEVSDDGIGIPQEIIDRIFEPFFTTKGLGAGTGLGLSTVQGVLRGHGAFIDASSDLGMGSTFRVCFPAHVETAAAVDERDDEPVPRGAGEVILVVDDEVPIIDITRQILETSGYGVRTATNGEEAIELYRREEKTIALIVTDMMMPVMDGAALITALRLINRDVPIIAVSGHIDPNQMSRVTNAGATTFLSKPYSGEAVLHLLSQVLQNSRLPPETQRLPARSEAMRAERAT